MCDSLKLTNSVDKHISLLEALKVLNDTSMKILFVTNNDNSLYGVANDGDIRRALLRGLPLTSPLKDACNTNPITADINSSEEYIISLMRNNNVNEIPLLDNGIPKELFTKKDLEILTSKIDNYFVIIAGGIGSRLKPLTETIPKPMLEVDNRPILEHIILNAKKQGFKNFFISVNYLKEKIINYFGDGSKFGICISYLEENKWTGTAGSLGLIPDKSKKPIVVTNGDILTNLNFKDLLSFHINSKSVATMAVKNYEINNPYGEVSLNDDEIISINEKPTYNCFINAGIYILNPIYKKFIKKEEFLNMTNLFSLIKKNKFKVSAYPIYEDWIDIGDINKYENIKGKYKYIE